MKITKTKGKHMKKNDTSEKISKAFVKSIFKSAGYEFIEERPKGRLLFYERATDSNIQFWLDRKNSNLMPAVLLISNRSYDRGIRDGMSVVRGEVKKALGITETK